MPIIKETKRITVIEQLVRVENRNLVLKEPLVIIQQIKGKQYGYYYSFSHIKYIRDSNQTYQ
jgi:hypothetical protein